MVDLKEFPEIMRGAKEDLTANVTGRFSPEDWDHILERARAQFEKRRAGSTDLEAWHAVMLDFYRSDHWGYRADYRPPRAPRKKMNLGVRFVWMTFMTFTLTKIAVAWTGQIYSRSGERRDLFVLLFVIAAVLTNFGYFLWQYRNHQD